MTSKCKKTLIFLIVLALMMVPCSGMAAGAPEEGDPQVQVAQMTTDALLVRPLGIVSTVLGLGLFIVSVPFSALGGNTDKAWNAFVVRPAKFTFARPLGEFN
jgi:hypothetical protein